MYRIEDTASAIKEIQHYLRTVTDDIHVVESGVTDDNTRNAVREFQKQYGIPQTGIVDYKTFTALRDEYDKAALKDRVSEATIGYLSFPVTRESSTREIYYINTKIQEILRYYGAEITQNVSAVFNSELEESIMILREIFQSDGDAVIDEDLYARIAGEHRSIKKENSGEL